MTATLKDWMAVATRNERAMLARLARTSTNYLYQLANDIATNPGADLAGRIEAATIEMAAVDKRLPTVSRTSIAQVCASCPFASKCLR